MQSSVPVPARPASEASEDEDEDDRRYVRAAMGVWSALDETRTPGQTLCRPCATPLPHAPILPAAAGAQIESAYQQPAFQPTATPLSNFRRFLVWNGVGTIVARDEETSSAVDVEFHNAQKHK